MISDKISTSSQIPAALPEISARLDKPGNMGEIRYFRHKLVRNDFDIKA